MTTDFPRLYPKARTVDKNGNSILIEPGDNDPRMRPVVASLHVAASLALSLFRFFKFLSGGIESHLYLLRDGTWEQYRKFNFEADGQLGGNTWLVDGQRLGSIIIETQGLGGGFLSRAQKAELKEFALWANVELGIPLRVVTSPNPTALFKGGWGYHSLFPEWNSLKKTCPGWRRIAWFNNKFRPWLREQSLQEFDALRAGESITDFARRVDVSVARLWTLNRPVPRVGERVRIR